MLRVTTLYASSASASASYYTQYLAQAVGEASGVWHGAQAYALGLSRVVTSDALRLVLEGRDPTSATPLGRLLADRYTTDGRLVRAVAGFDATFSAPKSVSVLWALTGDDRILDVHDRAVAAALAHLERFGATTRIRVNGGRVHPDAGGLTMAAFRQSTSRADDPQLHTHVVISAKVQTDDGRWWALDARYLKRHQRMLGGLYQSALRAGMVERFGVAWDPIVNGQAEVTGMPPELLAALSKRTVQVEAALAGKVAEFRSREGRDPSRWERAAHSREAAVDSRAHKSGAGVADLVTRWHDEAAQLVAGADGLVVVEGPAGDGKTRMLRAALDDLTARARPAFGLAPTARAARVLETETGLASDTIAKLLHEYGRPDRPPAVDYVLPAGTTIVVDESGMIGTPSLARLAEIARPMRVAGSARR